MRGVGEKVVLGAVLGCVGCRSGGRRDQADKGEGARRVDTMISACGLVCTECPIYRAAGDAEFAEELAQGWREGGHAEAKAEWFRCRGCHGPDELVWTEDCKIRACCKGEKGLANCSWCGEFPCALIVEFENDGHAHHRAAVKRLREMARG